MTKLELLQRALARSSPETFFEFEFVNVTRQAAANIQGGLDGNTSCSNSTCSNSSCVEGSNSGCNNTACDNGPNGTSNQLCHNFSCTAQN